MASRWYVLCSKLNKEEILLNQLQSQGYEVFYPRHFSSDGKTGRIQIRAYFPGYLFIRIDLSKASLSTFQWMPNTDGLVSFGQKPAFVPDTLVEAIQRHVLALNAERQRKEQDRETHLRVREPSDYGLILDPRLSSDERVRQLLRMLQGLSYSTGAGGE